MRLICGLSYLIRGVVPALEAKSRWKTKESNYSFSTYLM